MFRTYIIVDRYALSLNFSKTTLLILIQNANKAKNEGNCGFTKSNFNYIVNFTTTYWYL